MTDWSDKSDVVPRLKAVSGALEEADMCLASCVIDDAIYEIERLRSHLQYIADCGYNKEPDHWRFRELVRATAVTALKLKEHN